MGNDALQPFLKDGCSGDNFAFKHRGYDEFKEKGVSRSLKRMILFPNFG
jgi:hypothetical protein